MDECFSFFFDNSEFLCQLMQEEPKDPERVYNYNQVMVTMKLFLFNFISCLIYNLHSMYTVSISVYPRMIHYILWNFKV